MRFTSHPSTVLEMDMAPMIDMTFQLISFFMFVINFNNELVDERVKLPVAELARPVNKAAVQPLFLNVSRDGKLLLPGRELDVHEPQQMARINAYLRKEASYIKFAMHREGKNPDQGLEATVIIRAHQATQYGAVQDLIRAAREAGFVHFSLRAQVKPD